MPSPASRPPRVLKASVVTLSLVYFVLLHLYIYDNGFSAAAGALHSFADTLSISVRQAVDVERCPLHPSEILHQGMAEPAEIPAGIRLIHRRPEIEYCGFYLSSMPGLEELLYPGIFYPDTLHDLTGAPRIHEKVCDECRRIAFIYLEPHYGLYRGANALWRFPNYSLISPPRPSPPKSSRSIAALR